MAYDIVAIDDHGLFCAGLELVIERHLPEAGFRAFSSIEAATGAAGAHPDAVLLDIELDGRDGIEAVPDLRTAWPAARIILISSHVDAEIVERAAAMGVTACVSKAEAPEHLVDLIRAAIPSLAPRAGAAATRLTSRQVEIMALIREGLSNKAIANRLGLSAFTVQVHVQTIFRALGVANRTQAVYEAQRLRLIK
jgi:two-component system nitrate/nitrite response regulator NarL